MHIRSCNRDARPIRMSFPALTTPILADQPMRSHHSAHFNLCLFRPRACHEPSACFERVPHGRNPNEVTAKCNRNIQRIRNFSKNTINPNIKPPILVIQFYRTQLVGVRICCSCVQFSMYSFPISSWSARCERKSKNASRNSHSFSYLTVYLTVITALTTCSSCTSTQNNILMAKIDLPL